MIWLYISASAILFIAVVIWALSSSAFTSSFCRVKDTKKYYAEGYERMRRKGHGNVVERIEAGKKLLSELPHTDEYIKSYDGLRLYARYYPNGESKLTVILVHGYKSYAEHDFACVAEFYRSLGVNLLFVDQRSHGKSEGKYITFGAHERYDIRDWCLYINQKYPGCRLILDGISMGCATVLLAAALPDAPGNICGIIADCGYVSPAEEIAYIMKRNMRLPKFPLYYTTELVSRHRAKFAFSDVSTLDAVRKIKVPVLFVHGDEDTFVPTDNTHRNYDASVSEKKIKLIVPGASHGLSYMTDETGCQTALREFIGGL